MMELSSRRKGLIGFAILIWIFGNSLLQAAERGSVRAPSGDGDPVSEEAQDGAIRVQVSSVIVREAVSASGEKFQQVFASGLGESWRDPSGPIWGEVLREEDSLIPHKVTQDRAVELCHERGGRLPTHAEFSRLRQWFTSGKGKKGAYRADILPQLDAGSFWTETSREGVESGAYIFHADDGDFSYEERSSERASVRCVIPTLDR